MMPSSETRETIVKGNVDVTGIENGFKKDKARAKSNFTRAQFCSYRGPQEIGSFLEIVLDILENFLNFYTRQKEHKKCENFSNFYTRQKEHKKCERIVARCYG